MLTLMASFFIVALLYATVGFGGGSSYIALLAAANVPYTVIPKLSLICNILVVSGGCWHYLRAGHFNHKLIFPFVLSSVPAAYLGGSFPITEKTFYFLLTFCIGMCGFRLLMIPDRTPEKVSPPGTKIAILTGGVLGLLSGMVGIGGGIFLSPILINAGWARSKEAAAIASGFIFLNSIAGLAGNFAKNSDIGFLIEYHLLFIAVILGGQLGSRFGTNHKVSYSMIQKSTGILSLFIGFKLLSKLFY